MPRHLDSVPPPADGGMSGERLLRMVGDLVNEHLADVPLDDPYRVGLYTLATAGAATRPRTVKEVSC